MTKLALLRRKYSATAAVVISPVVRADGTRLSNSHFGWSPFRRRGRMFCLLLFPVGPDSRQQSSI